MRRLIALILLMVSYGSTSADDLVITTWNLETIGASSGRGWASGFGKDQLPPRTNGQLRKIAHLIRDTLKSDIIGVQEVAITHRAPSGASRCKALDRLTTHLGTGWQYTLPWVDEIPEDHANLFSAYLYNTDRVRKVQIYGMNVANPWLAGARLFPRKPLIGYFEAIKDGSRTNDFVIVNIHLKSGQGHDENHLIAATVLEWELTRSLEDHGIKESDRIIMGDFNDNPYRRKSNGKPEYSGALYEHLKFKGYLDLVTADSHSTRMNNGLDSIIDHILVNTSAKRHIVQDRADIYVPGRSESGFPETLATWRSDFSDHFPISFQLKIESRDDDTDF